MNSAECVKCGQTIEFRAVDVAGRESYWFHKDTTNRGQRGHVARPASTGRIRDIEIVLAECNRAWREGVDEPISHDARLALIDEHAALIEERAGLR